MVAYASDLYYLPTISNLGIPSDLTEKLVISATAVAGLVGFDWDRINANRTVWQSHRNRQIAG